MTTRIAFAGEDIKAGSSIFLVAGHNTIFAAGSLADENVGKAVEDIRNGMRVAIKDGEVREDDA